MTTAKAYTILGVLPTLNEYVDAERRNRFIGAKIKKEATEFVRLQMLGKPKITKPCTMEFIWCFSSKADFDNIRFAVKFILDGMANAGILVNDNQKWVLGFTGDYFTKVAKGEEKIIITVQEYNT